MNVDDYIKIIDQILFAVYYLGVERIILFSKKQIAKETRAMIRKTLTNMSGTEISYEDKQKLRIRVLLDKTRVDVIQVIYRIFLIIELSIINLLEGPDISEIRMNENEIDRLYHLLAKVISLALIDTNVLKSSGINHTSLVPSFYLISKRLENLADAVNHLAIYLNQSKEEFEDKEGVLKDSKIELSRGIKHIIGGFPSIFIKMGSVEIKLLYQRLKKIKDITVADYLKEIIRYLINIQEEIVNISFYQSLIKQKTI